MRDIFKEKELERTENVYFKYLKLVQERELTENEKKKLLKCMGLKIEYLEEEFLAVREEGENSLLDYIVLNKGLELINDLKDGFNITKNFFERTNIEQWAAHYESIREYEDCFIEFYNSQARKDFENTIDCFEDCKDYLGGYTKEKTLTKC